MLFLKKSYNYEELAKKISRLVVQNSSSNAFYLHSIQFLCETFQAEGGALILKNREKYAVCQCLGWDNFSLPLDPFAGFIQWLKKHSETVTRLQLLEDPQYAAVRSPGLNFFIQFQAEVCVPLWISGELLGFFTLAPKKGGRSYSPSCLKLLNWIAPQLAQGFQNALLTERLKFQEVELDAVKDLKGQIVANLSHELKTPLTSVIGFAELLAEEIDGPLNEAQQKHIQQVLNGSNRLLKILTALSDLAKLEGGNLPLNVQSFHLSPLIASLIGELPFNRDTKVQIEITQATPRIYGDLGLVKQIFRHVLDNAAKYTPEGAVQVSAGKKGEMLEVCVADTGIGISEEKLSRIFDEFYQADGGLTRCYEGFGIGLTLSKRLVELHGGRMWVKSHPGKGSRFYFTLPLKPVVIRQKELAA